ncbi:MAG: hypothetical protein D6689_13040 [Deltaproteobacteria bacterium]|nr:MAG: hypothetical protein D6689_13040 [Deltaproteobacteria bacterium]
MNSFAGRGRHVLAAASLLLAAACAPTPEARVGDARLAYADGVEAPPAGGTDVIVVPNRPAALPDGAAPLRIAVDRDAVFADVWPLIRAVRDRGVPAVFYVHDRRRRVRVMAIDPPPGGRAIRVTATAADGKVCVNLPDVPEAKCAMTAQRRVDRPSVRQFVREAFRASGIRKVRVDAEGGLRWSDVVRAVDGARTCCQGEQMEVGLSLLQ